MSEVSSALRRHTVSGLYRALAAFWREADAFLGALLHPAPLVLQGEQIHRLLKQAHAIEASDPAHAALLRRRAARIGLE